MQAHIVVLIRAMSRSRFRQCVACLLMVLLPLQAAAAARLALCAEMGAATSTPVAMDHCDRMQMASGSQMPEQWHQHHHERAGCWLGSVCLAATVVVALPAAQQAPLLERSTPSYFVATTFYRSIVIDDPQRPPTPL